MRIEQVEQNVGILVQTGSVDDDFIMLGHFEEKIFDAGTFGDVDIVYDIFNLCLCAKEKRGKSEVGIQ